MNSNESEGAKSFRVLQFGKYFSPAVGGIEAVIKLLADGLNDAGIETDVLCADHAFRVSKPTESFSYRVTRARRYARLFSTAISPGLIYFLGKNRKKYDLIHLHMPDPMAGLAYFLVRPRAKLVLHWHSDVVRQKLTLKLYQFLQNWLIDRAEAIVVTSPNYAQTSKALQSHLSKCTVIPIGIVDPCPSFSTVSARDNFASPLVVFALGRLCYYKGYSYLVEAAQFLPENVKVLIGGDGPLRSELEKLIEEKGLSEKVQLLGFLSDVEIEGLFAACQVFCLPSVERTEAFGVVLLEAMARGKALLTTAITGSGVSWVNQNDITGLVVRCRDSRGLSDAILRFSTDPAYLETCRLASRKRFESEFVAQKMIERVVELYKLILSR